MFPVPDHLTRAIRLTALAVLAALPAAQALAHEGAHLHPHGGDPAWLPLLGLGLAVAAAAAVLRGRFR